jgi:hypothetical protein
VNRSSKLTTDDGETDGHAAEHPRRRGGRQTTGVGGISTTSKIKKINRAVINPAANPAAQSVRASTHRFLSGQ